jgi:hypothetical protein
MSDERYSLPLARALAASPFQVGRHGGPYADRTPYPSERNYFSANPLTAGMAAEDGKVVMNPFTALSAQEKESVRSNELARLLMRENPAYKPNFGALTPQQSQNLLSTEYANAPEPMRQETIAARQFSGDPSGGAATPEQEQFLNALRTYFGVRGAPFGLSK